MEKIEVKYQFAIFKLLSLLSIWIQHQEKPLGHFYCARFTHKSCDFNEFMLEFREIKPENCTGKVSKKSQLQIRIC